MMVGEHQLLGNRIANLILSFFCMVLFQFLLVQKLFKIVSFGFLFQEKLRLGYQDHQLHFLVAYLVCVANSRLISKLSQAVPVKKKSSFLIPSGTTFSLLFAVASNDVSIRRIISLLAQCPHLFINVTTFLFPVNALTANPNDKCFPGRSFPQEHEYMSFEALDSTNLDFLEDAVFFP